MFQQHDAPLVIAWIVGLAGWLLARRVLPAAWPERPEPVFERPWREFGIALVGGIGVLALGQLWSRGIRLPEEGPLGPSAGAVNQVLIFAPMLLVPVARRQPATTAWLPSGRVATRLAAGVVLAALAVGAYALLRSGTDAPWRVLARIWVPSHVDRMAQVFCEDVVIAILFVRLSAALGRGRAIVAVACLFAAGHVPAMLAQDVDSSEFAGLLRDTALGVAVLLVLRRSRDVLWFWPLHYCLDMTQFANIRASG